MNIKSVGPKIKSFRVTDEDIIEDLDDYDETCTDEVLYDIHSPNYRGVTAWGMLPGSPDRYIETFLEESPFELAFRIHFGRSWAAYNVRKTHRTRKTLVTRKPKPKAEDRWVM